MRQRCLMMAALLLASLCAGATAAPRSRVEYVHGDSSSTTVKVHPRYVTVLYFPGKVENLINSDAVGYIAGMKEKRVIIRSTGKAAEGANLAIDTDGLKALIVLEAVEDSDDADAQVVFKRQPAPAQK